MVITKTYTEPPICKKEILRYAGCKNSSDRSIEALLDECLEEVLPKLNYKVCYLQMPIVVSGDTCEFDYMKVQSKDLMKNLNGCERAVLFAATIGIEIDRLIRKYTAVSPAKALMFQAIGAERIESLCDMFCAQIKSELCENVCESMVLRPRFSPGYGDLSLDMQREIFELLACSKNIGVSLNDSLLMSPSKSVTAFIGIGRDVDGKERSKCAACAKTDCEYRGV